MSAGPTLTAVPFTRVKLADNFWAPRQAVNRRVTLPIEYEHCRATGRIDAFRLAWKPGQPNPPHIFWDSDVAKWIEAAAYSLQTHPDRHLERRVDQVVALIAKAQQPDGYLNTHFTVVAPEKRWANLRDHHELYCAGHLIEAAVAYHAATGKRQFLEVMCRYADLIAQVFGRGPGQKRGYCGHEEIELALVKLYRATNHCRYLDLARYFIDERGQQPDSRYCQAHRPVRKQSEVVGHAVRAMYLYCGMADVAREAGDSTLIPPLRKLWRHLTQKRLYVTGGIGSTRANEGFTFDYDLPNESAYCETCASVGLVFWAHRMLQLTGASEFADVMERVLYNACLSGVSLDGRRFFYANPLAVDPPTLRGATGQVAGQRQEWFGCACCPPNLARLIASVGQYFYSENKNTAAVHLYGHGTTELCVARQTVRLHVTTQYPWNGVVKLRVTPERTARFTLALRIPNWCPSFTLTVNNHAVAAQPVRGYVRLTRQWQASDSIRLTLAMPVTPIEANPQVRMNCGRVALQRGPIVYCLEEVDNGPALNDLCLAPAARFVPVHRSRPLGGVTVLRGQAWRRQPWPKATLYRPGPTPRRRVPVTAIPYCVWGNRRPGEEMLVWINAAPVKPA